MRNNLGVSIAIVDSGAIRMLHRLDNAQLSVRIAEAKARTAVEFRRPTKRWRMPSPAAA